MPVIGVAHEAADLKVLAVAPLWLPVTAGDPGQQHEEHEQQEER
jgi:hypothetical protein